MDHRIKHHFINIQRCHTIVIQKKHLIIMGLSFSVKLQGVLALPTSLS